MKQFLYWIQINFVNLISDIRGLVFTAKLKYNVWRYGGGENIPADKVGAIMGPISENGIKVWRALANVFNVGEKFDLPIVDCDTGVLIVHYDMGKIEDVEVFEFAVLVLDQCQTLEGTFKTMRQMDDITREHMDALRDSGRYDEFMAWLKANEPTNPLDLLIKKKNPI